MEITEIYGQWVILLNLNASSSVVLPLWISKREREHYESTIESWALLRSAFARYYLGKAFSSMVVNFVKRRLRSTYRYIQVVFNAFLIKSRYQIHLKVP